MASVQAPDACRLVHGRKFGSEEGEVGQGSVRLEFAGEGAVLERGEERVRHTQSDSQLIHFSSLHQNDFSEPMLQMKWRTGDRNRT
jgi:hypothetical protein